MKNTEKQNYSNFKEIPGTLKNDRNWINFSDHFDQLTRHGSFYEFFKNNFYKLKARVIACLMDLLYPPKGLKQKTSNLLAFI
ncbi:hypothetical protein NMT12_40064 [metagenome]